MISKTTIQLYDNAVVLIRLLNTNFYEVEFKIDVIAKDLIPYFNLQDDDFIKLSVRYYKV